MLYIILCYLGVVGSSKDAAIATKLSWLKVGQGPTMLATVVGGDCWDFFSRLCYLFVASTFLWEKARDIRNAITNGR